MRTVWGDRPAVRRPRAKRKRDSAKHKSMRRTEAIRTVGPTLTLAANPAHFAGLAAFPSCFASLSETV